MTALRLLRAGVRGARRARRRSPTGPAPSTSSTPRADRVRRRVVPLPAGGRASSIASLEAARRRRHRRRPRSVLARRRRSTIEPGETRRAGRAVGRGQDDAGRAGARASTTSPAARCASTATTCATSPGVAARRDRRGHPGPAPVPRDRSATTCATPGPTPPTPSSIAACRAARIHDVDRGAARRVRHHRRRARLPAVGRREAAPGDRPACC